MHITTYKLLEVLSILIIILQYFESVKNNPFTNVEKYSVVRSCCIWKTFEKLKTRDQSGIKIKIEFIKQRIHVYR
jgi:hypothetical protein